MRRWEVWSTSYHNPALGLSPHPEDLPFPFSAPEVAARVRVYAYDGLRWPKCVLLGGLGWMSGVPLGLFEGEGRP